MGIRGFLKRLFHRSTDASEAPVHEAQPQHVSKAAATTVPRPVKRKSDFPLDIAGQPYTPPITSSKASFRSDGNDHERDQDFAFASASEWNDEDLMTNKSGDPRIGTHRRNQQPSESRSETRK